MARHTNSISLKSMYIHIQNTTNSAFWINLFVHLLLYWGSGYLHWSTSNCSNTNRKAVHWKQIHAIRVFTYCRSIPAQDIEGHFGFRIFWTKSCNISKYGMNLKFETIVRIFRKIIQLNAVIILKSTNEYYRKLSQEVAAKWTFILLCEWETIELIEALGFIEVFVQDVMVTGQ